MDNIMWSFDTANFRIEWSISDCYDLDLSWDDSGEVREGINSGKYIAFDSHVTVTHKPTEIKLGSSFLGQSIYENPADFRDHIGINIKSRKDNCNYGSYFTDMVKEAIKEARKNLDTLPKTI